MSLKTFIVEIEDTAVADLKAVGTVLENFVLSEGQKLVAQAKQTDLGTLALNLINTLESTTMSGTAKMSAVVAAVVAEVPKFIANGSIPGLVTSIEDFAIEFAQSAYNDFKTNVLGKIGLAATSTSTATQAGQMISQAA